MVDIVIVADAVFKMDIVIEGCQDIFLGDMLRNQVVSRTGQRFHQRFTVVAARLQDLLQFRIEDHRLRQADLLRCLIAEIDIFRDIHHHIGKDLDVPLLGLDHHGGNCRVLDLIRQFSRHLRTCLSQHFTGGHIDDILSQDMAGDPVAEHQLLIEFVASDPGEVIASGIKEHACHQALGALHCERLAGTDLFIQLKKTCLVAVRHVFLQGGLDLGFVAEQFDDLAVCADSERPHQDGRRYLSRTVDTDIENIV